MPCVEGVLSQPQNIKHTEGWNLVSIWLGSNWMHYIHGLDVHHIIKLLRLHVTSMLLHWCHHQRTAHQAVLLPGTKRTSNPRKRCPNEGGVNIWIASWGTTVVMSCLNLPCSFLAALWSMVLDQTKSHSFQTRLHSRLEMFGICSFEVL